MNEATRTAAALPSNTVAVLLREARDRLNDISDAPALEGEGLLLHVLNRAETSWLLAHGEHELTARQHEQFEVLMKRRMTGEPLAYVIGEWEFCGRKFMVNRDVLIPRPSTENLIDKTIQYLDKNRPFRTPYVIADVGTGSGCIAVTLACELARILNHEFGNMNFVATDISRAALDVAKHNAARHGVLDQIEFIVGDMLAPLEMQQVDLIVSNPPYVPAAELSLVNKKKESAGLGFEPKLALDGGLDGKRYVEVIKQSGTKAIIETVGGEIEEIG